MSPIVARTAIERHFSNSEAFEEIEFHFFGGEPFLEFDTIREVTEWVWSNKWPKPYIFFAPTNGTLIHGNIEKWAAIHKKRMYLGLSLDGTPAMQNANRSNSYNRINVPFFLANWPDQPIKMTVSANTLPHLAEGVIYLQKMGFKVHCNLAHGPDWSHQGIREVFAAELVKLMGFYTENPHLELCSLFDLPFEALSNTDKRNKKWCGAGTEMVAIDVDGREYPCQLFMPMVMDSTLASQSKLLYDNPESLRDNHCDSCDLLPLCPTCYGMNILNRGDPAIRDPIFCDLFKIQALAASKLQALMLLRRHKIPRLHDISPRTTLRILDGIRRIQSTVSM